MTSSRFSNLHGRCQNASWTNGPKGTLQNFRYCGEPALDLLTNQRARCVACGSHAGAFHDRMMADIVNGFDVHGAAKWLAKSKARYLDQCWFAYQYAGQGHRLEKVREQQRWADQTAEIGNAMLARWGDEIRHAIAAAEVQPGAIELTAEDLEPYGLPTYGVTVPDPAPPMPRPDPVDAGLLGDLQLLFA